MTKTQRAKIVSRLVESGKYNLQDLLMLTDRELSARYLALEREEKKSGTSKSKPIAIDVPLTEKRPKRLPLQTVDENASGWTVLVQYQTYRGQPMISLTAIDSLGVQRSRPFAFGLNKARMILSAVDQIRDFVDAIDEQALKD